MKAFERQYESQLPKSCVASLSFNIQGTDSGKIYKFEVGILTSNLDVQVHGKSSKDIKNAIILLFFFPVARDLLIL